MDKKGPSARDILIEAAARAAETMRHPPGEGETDAEFVGRFLENADAIMAGIKAEGGAVEGGMVYLTVPAFVRLKGILERVPESLLQAKKG